MPILVNGELLPKALVQEEAQRLSAMPAWKAFADGLEKQTQLRQAAEASAIDRLLLHREAEKDARPVDPELVENEVQRLRSANGFRTAIDDSSLRRQIERELRRRRAIQDLMGLVPPPTEQDIASFYKEQAHNFQCPEAVHAAHIVKHVDEGHTEEEARAGIQAALAELESGQPFGVVAERHSDCKGNGGDLGVFQRGTMVEEFESVVFAMQPGECSPIFRTPFGFHVAEVRARIPPHPAPLGEVRDVINGFLTAMQQGQAMGRLAQALRANANILRISVGEAEEIAARGAAG